MGFKLDPVRICLHTEIANNSPIGGTNYKFLCTGQLLHNHFLSHHLENGSTGCKEQTLVDLSGYPASFKSTHLQLWEPFKIFG